MDGCWEVKNIIPKKNKFNPVYISTVHGQTTLTVRLKGTKSFYLPRTVGGWGPVSGAGLPADPFLN